jgi:Uncharacterized protein conserved in archaea
MNIDELQSVRDRERQTDKPQQLRESFYRDVGTFVEQLRAERERAAERHDSPYADEVMQLTDEIDAAQQLVEDIHERRIGKVVKAASLEAAELSPEVKGLTTEERDLFEQLVSDIEHHRNEVLSTVEENEPGPTEEETGEDATSAEPAVDSAEVTAADLMGPDGATPDDDRAETGQKPVSNGNSQSTRSVHDPEDAGSAGGVADASADAPGGPERGRQQGGPGSTATDRRPATETDGGSQTDSVGSTADDPAAEHHSGQGSRPDADADNGQPPVTDGFDREQSTSEAGDSVERDRVLVTESVATFVGADDRDYDLAAADVVTLPSTNAALLVERDVARRL